MPLSDVDPETGEMSPATRYAHACLIAEVEVDDETGDVTVLKMTSAYEIGRAINPKLVEQQLVGGSWMGMSHALYETPEPTTPTRARVRGDFNEYLMPGPGDICPHDILVLERRPTDRSAPRGPARCAPIRCCRPSPTRSSTPYACASTICLITPEKVLRALKARGGAAPGSRAVSLNGGASKIVGIGSPRELEEALRAAYYLADDEL